MTITAVRNQISSAFRDLRVTDAEMKAVIDATKSKLSNGEVKEIGDLYDVVTRRASAPPGAQVCFPQTIDKPAMNRLNAFIEAKKLPIGPAQKEKVKDAIQDLLMRVRLAPPQMEKPRGLEKLIPIRLDDTRIAHVDIVKKRFTLEYTNDAGPSSYHVGLGLPAID